MRDLKECQAEVFRRSEKRIRRRRRILTVCVPLVLCAVLLSRTETPKPEYVSRPGDPAGFADAAPEVQYESVECFVSRIEVTGSGMSRSFTDAGELLVISAGLDSMMVREPESTGSAQSDNRGVVRDESAEDMNEADSGYTVTVIMSDGKVIEYGFAGNRLENRTSKETCILTPGEVNRLKALLGISAP